MNLIGEKVKIYLINSLSAEGTVQSWSDTQVVLVSNNRKLVINNPNNNIIMYYILSESFIDNSSLDKIKSIALSSESENKSEVDKISDPDLRFKRLAELKIMSAQAQREQIKKQLTTFHSINTDQILGKYGTPSFISSQHDSPQEINNGNAIDFGSLPQVPRKTSE